MRKLLVLMLVGGSFFNVLCSAFLFVLGHPLFGFFSIATGIGVVSSVLLTRSMAVWEVRVDGGRIHYKSLFRRREFTFFDIQRAVTAKGETRFYSGEGEKLFSILRANVGYELFMDCLAARNIAVFGSL